MAIKMKKCVKCGKLIPDFAKYCVYCRQSQSKSPNSSTPSIDFSSIADKVNDFKQTQNRSASTDNNTDQTAAPTEQITAVKAEITDNAINVSDNSSRDGAFSQDQNEQSSQAPSVAKSSSVLMFVIIGLIAVIIALIAFIIIHNNHNDNRDGNQDDDYAYTESSSYSDDDSDDSYSSSSSDDDSDTYEDTDDEDYDYAEDDQDEGTDSNLTGEDDSTTPDFSTEVLSDDYIEGLSDEELQLEINTLYAVKGYHFKTPSIQEYFDSKSWYEDEGITDQNEIKDSLDSTELENWEKLSRERDNRR